MSIDQPTLFDPEPFNSPPKHPGDLTPEEWMSRPDVVFHGTFNDGTYEDEPPLTVHFGSKKSAQDRVQKLTSDMGLVDTSTRTNSGRTQPLNGVRSLAGWHPAYDWRGPTRNLDAAASYVRFNEDNAKDEWYSDPDNDLEPDDYVESRKADAVNERMSPGRIKARRINPNRHGETLSDADANHVDLEYWNKDSRTVQESDAPSSIQNTEPPDGWSPPDAARVAAAHASLDAGLPVPYDNGVEEPGSTSYIVPRPDKTTRTYWHDVMRSPNRSPEEKAHARKAVLRGEVPVPFDVSVPNTAPQGRLFRETFSPSKGSGYTLDPNFDSLPEQMLRRATGVVSIPRPQKGA